MRPLRLLFTVGAAGIAFGGIADAYFEIELVKGGTVLAESYTEDGDKLHVYRPSGTLELDRSAVKEIRERSGSLAETASRAPAPEPAAEPAAATPAGAVVESAPAVVVPEEGDPAAIEQALTMKVILAHRDLLFARNAGEDEETIKKREKEIDALEKRRDQLRNETNQ